MKKFYVAPTSLIGLKRGVDGLDLSTRFMREREERRGRRGERREGGGEGERKGRRRRTGDAEGAEGKEPEGDEAETSFESTTTTTTTSTNSSRPGSKKSLSLLSTSSTCTLVPPSTPPTTLVTNSTSLTSFVPTFSSTRRSPRRVRSAGRPYDLITSANSRPRSTESLFEQGRKLDSSSSSVLLVGGGGGGGGIGVGGKDAFEGFSLNSSSPICALGGDSEGFTMISIKDERERNLIAPWLNHNDSIDPLEMIPVIDSDFEPLPLSLSHRIIPSDLPSTRAVLALLPLPLPPPPPPPPLSPTTTTTNGGIFERRKSSLVALLTGGGGITGGKGETGGAGVGEGKSPVSPASAGGGWNFLRRSSRT